MNHSKSKLENVINLHDSESSKDEYENLERISASLDNDDIPTNKNNMNCSSILDIESLSNTLNDYSLVHAIIPARIDLHHSTPQIIMLRIPDVQDG